MYVDLDYGTWRQLDVTPANCRRSKAPQSFDGTLDILMPGIKDVLPGCRKHTIPRLIIPALYVGEGDTTNIVLYYRAYADPFNMDDPKFRDYSETYPFLSTFCTNEEMAGFLKLRWPKMTDVEIAENLVWCRNMSYRDLNTGLLHPGLRLPEPYHTKLFTEFAEPWKPIVL